jgi:hypothetical protein
VRFLVEANDRLVSIRDVHACYVVPGIGHGNSNYEPQFVEHVQYFLTTQLADWSG